MFIQRFEDLLIWQEARKLCTAIYATLADNRDWGFKDQIQRAAVSIMNNIAEGYERNKFTKDNKQFISFLNIANGSCGEVKSMLYLAQDLSYIEPQQAEKLRNDCLSITLKTQSLVSTLQENNGRDNREKNELTCEAPL
jgi:four helix bundle protein